MDRSHALDSVWEFSEGGAWMQVMLYQLLDQATLSELDRRYWTFVKKLPSCLAQLASDRRITVGEGPSMPLQAITGIGLSIGIPWMFHNTFPDLDEGQVLDIGESWLFLLLALLLRDYVADDQVPASSDVEELRRCFVAKGREVLSSFVGNRPSFWPYLDRYEQQVVSALQLEAHYRTSPGEEYDLTIAWQIGAGKSALYKMIPCAMAVLSEAEIVLPALERSMDALAAASQLFDDISDWEEDLDRGHYTYPLAQAVNRLQRGETVPSPQAVAAEMANSTIREEALIQVRAWYEQALAAVEGIPCQGWTDLVQHGRADCLAFHRWLILYRIAEAVKGTRHTD